jgi:hypothetical protein
LIFFFDGESIPLQRCLNVHFFTNFDMKSIITILVFLSFGSFCFGQRSAKKILFDATKAEMCTNADWIIDADTRNVGTGAGGIMAVGSGNESNPLRIPTPAQSGITATTLETYWSGALSAWAVDMAKLGFPIETLPIGAAITYGNAANPQDLANYKVYVVDEPNILFTAAEKTAIVNYVRNGGSLFMVSDHTVSDRNNDGKDSPDIWNDLMNNNSVQVNPFGIKFDLVNFSELSSNFANLPTNPILNGSAGVPNQIQFSNGTTMTLNTTANPSALGLAFKSGSSSTGTTNVMFAQASYGAGRVVALGDSSPPDDGTGDPNDNLYYGYGAEAGGSHQKLLVNATLWLAEGTSAVGEINGSDAQVVIFPNPVGDILNLSIGSLSGKEVVSRVSVFNIQGEKVEVEQYKGKTDIINLNTQALGGGVYFVRVLTESGSVLCSRFVKM